MSLPERPVTADSSRANSVGFPDVLYIAKANLNTSRFLETLSVKTPKGGVPPGKQNSMNPLYIGATLQDSGKTSVSLGLFQALLDRGHNPGYMKPVGQRYVEHFGQSIDEDAYLFHEVFGLRDRGRYMSPIAIKRNFTRDFINRPDAGALEARIIKCADRIADKHDSMLIEGTGHAGVGSCFGLSNGRVARILGARVVIVASGGIGKPIDEISLNMALFEKYGVEVLGVILNKVFPSKYDMIKDTVHKGLKVIGTRLLGAIPYVSTLTHYTMGQVAEEFGYEVLCGKHRLNNKIQSTVVLAMRPESSAKYIRADSLVITPKDRPESIATAITTLKSFSPSNGGIILSGGTRPDREVCSLIKDSDIPVLAAEDDTFRVSSRMVQLEFKISASDLDKIEELKGLVRRHIDIDLFA